MSIKYNIYKIKNEEFSNLISKLEASGLVKVKELEFDAFQLDFYYSSEPDEVDIWWCETYADFLDDLEVVPKNKIYYGTLLVSNEELCYAISLGKTHFYLRPFCDTEFGISLAERIVDEQNLKIKNSKYYKSKKSKSITSYQNETNFTYDTGESMHYIKAKTINPDSWGKIASFGTSVQLNLDITPSSLPSKIVEIEEVLQSEPNFSIPKADLIKGDDIIEELDSRLSLAILETIDDIEIGTQDFTVSGIDFVFSDSARYRIYVANSQTNTISDFTDLSISTLKSYMQNQGISDINKIKVKVDREEGRGFSKPVKEILEYVDSDRYCIIDGKWHKFNQSYIDYLKREVELINTVDMQSCNITRGMIEDDFNNLRVEEGYVNVDKDLITLAGRFKVEQMDLYKDETLFFVKKGTPQKLGYVIDQSINSIALLRNNESLINLPSGDSLVEKVCLWLIFARQTDIEILSDINSIIFLMKLADWRKISLDAGFEPKIYKSYIR